MYIYHTNIKSESLIILILGKDAIVVLKKPLIQCVIFNYNYDDAST